MKVKVPSYNKTLCILANTKVGDLYGHKIVSCLKNDFNLNDIQIIGNGGEFLKKHGQNSIFDLNDLREKFLYLWRYATKDIISMKNSPCHIYQVSLRMNLNLLQLVSRIYYYYFSLDERCFST
jgi:hypothetical protein